MQMSTLLRDAMTCTSIAPSPIDMRQRNARTRIGRAMRACGCKVSRAGPSIRPRTIRVQVATMSHDSTSCEGAEVRR